MAIINLTNLDDAYPLSPPVGNPDLADTINGLDGADTIERRGGGDTLNGGNGDDFREGVAAATERRGASFRGT